MPSIELVVANPKALDEELSLFFELRDTPIARKYRDALASSQRLAIYNPDRFYNFPNSDVDRHAIVERINQCVAAINAFAPEIIALDADPEMNQERLNRLHHYFEVLRGPVLEPSEFMRFAPLSVKLALEQLNLAIHHFETHERNERAVREGHAPAASVVVTFDRRQRHPLGEDDYAQFTKRSVFGSWHINYCEVGKPLWDVYEDKDDVIGDANVRPLRYYSADAILHFGATTSAAEHEAKMAAFWSWWTQNQSTLQRLGFEKGDPKNAIGSIPVADLARDRGPVAGRSDDEVRALISRHQHVSRVVLHDDQSSDEVRRVLEERVPARLAARPDLVRQINGSYQISLTGDGGGSWVIDVTRRGPAEVRRGTIDEANIRLTMAVDDFVELSRGEIEVQMAIVRGKLQFHGPLRLALGLRQLVG